MPQRYWPRQAVLARTPPYSAAPIRGIYSHPCESARWWRFCAWPRAARGRSPEWRSKATRWNSPGSGRRTRPMARCASRAWSRSRARWWFGCARPNVVPFTLRAADTMAAEDRADTFDDLKYYTEQIAPALEAGGINLLATNADTVYVELPNHTRRAILLSGLDYPYGYLLIDPGGPERILTCVYAVDDLLEELRVYFDLPDDTTSAQPRVAT